MSQTIYGVANAFCWAELYTPDSQKSKDFYNKLFSWTYETDEMTHEDSACSQYIHAMLPEGPVAGMMQIEGELKKQGVPPHWASYVGVKDAVKTVNLAKKLGASVIMPPKEIPQAGTMAVIQDPTGAFIHFWQPHKENQSPERNIHGMVGWNELLTADAAKAKEFYTNLFGWGTHEENVNGHLYTSFIFDNKFIGGMMQISKEMGPIPSHWSIYFTTNDIEASRKIAQEQGAMELSPLMTLPNIGKMIAIKDPADGIFSLFEWAK